MRKGLLLGEMSTPGLGERSTPEKCAFFFSDFQYGFRSSRLIVDLLTVVSDGISRDFNMSGTTQAVALDISKAFDRV